MNEGLERLKAIGAQKIHEQTHISRKNIDGIFQGSFKGMNPVQFAGFVSILEREYGLDLSGLKASFLAYWDAHNAPSEPVLETEAKSLVSKKNKNGVILAAAAGGVALLLALWPAQETVPPQPAEPVHVATALPETAVEAPVAEETAETAAEPVALPSLIIVPKTKLWVGMIDLETYTREQKLTSEPLVMDTNRSWLMIFGHGHFKVEQGEEISDFSSDNRLRFAYQNGTFREISRQEFKDLNRGDNW